MVDHDGATALHVAVSRGDIKAVAVLAAAMSQNFVRLPFVSKAAPEIIDRTMVGSGYTALHLAVLERSVDAIQVLLSARADPCVRDTTGRNALELAMRTESRKPLGPSAVKCLRRRMPASLLAEMDGEEGGESVDLLELTGEAETLEGSQKQPSLGGSRRKLRGDRSHRASDSSATTMTKTQRIPLGQSQQEQLDNSWADLKRTIRRQPLDENAAVKLTSHEQREQRETRPASVSLPSPKERLRKGFSALPEQEKEKRRRQRADEAKTREEWSAKQVGKAEKAARLQRDEYHRQDFEEKTKAIDEARKVVQRTERLEKEKAAKEKKQRLIIRESRKLAMAEGPPYVEGPSDMHGKFSYVRETSRFFTRKTSTPGQRR